MTLRDELEALDPNRIMAALDGAFDKCTSFDETGTLVDQLVDQFPALSGLIYRLEARIVEETDDEQAHRHVVYGGVFVLLGLIEYANSQLLRIQFPDAPEPSDW